MTEPTCDYCEDKGIVFIGPLPPVEKSMHYCIVHYQEWHAIFLAEEDKA